MNNQPPTQAECERWVAHIIRDVMGQEPTARLVRTVAANVRAQFLKIKYPPEEGATA